MPAPATINERRWEDCISNRQIRRNQSSMGYSFFIAGGVTLFLHHAWVVGLGQDPELEVLWVGCFLMLFNAMNWIAPTLLEGMEGRARMPRWKGFIWFVVLCALGAAMSWSVGRYVYGVNLFG
jgi:hypothetical protein